ncbi:dedicator of cytokinesis protein 4-like [Argopecten irradians]|uniref:dedicator of cytokinesis protein 4-like n=1 Tax=Argopecten irradians TaxID=31199 RepID=UPI003723D4E5
MAENTWRPSRKKYGVAIFNFNGDVKDGLRLQIGETVHIYEEYGTGAQGWYRGVSLHRKGPKGIFPAALIHIKECEVDNEGVHETITPMEDSMVKEVTYVLREWYTLWKSLFIKWGQAGATVQEIRNAMIHLMSLRGKLISAALSHEQAKELRQEIATLIDWGDGKLGMDLVPRVEGEPVDPDRYSVTGLYRLHTKSSSNTTPDMPKKRSSAESYRGDGKCVGMNHLLVNFKSSQCAIMEESVLYLSVYNARERKFISEQFEVCVNKNGLAQDQDKLSGYYGLFSDLSSEDLNKSLFLVIKIYRCGKMLAAAQQRGVGRTYRRPFGVGVMKVEEVKHMASTEKEYETMMKVTSCVDAENTFPDQHEILIKKALQEKSGSRLGSSFKEDKVNLGVTLSFKMFQGDLQAIKTEEAILFTKGVTVIPKLSFTDLIINPGQLRNDIYLTLVSGEYERGRKKSEKNVEIVVTALTSNGEEIKNCMSFGCGEKPQTNFYSTIYYHDNSPQWNETVRLSLPMEMLPKSQIRFDIYHCSTRGRENKKLVGFAFLCVTNNEDIVIQDGSHDLCIYQCEEISKVIFKKYRTLPYLYEDTGDPRLSVFPSNLAYKRSAKEKLTVKTQLCSTKYTQTSDLLGLLQWKLPENQRRLPTILEQFSKIEGVEIMKFLPDVLDSLFAIMTDSCSNEDTNASKVFQVLVYVLHLLKDSRFVTFLPVLENYLSDQFSSPVVHRDVLKCFAEGIHRYYNGGDFPVSLCLKVLEKILRFVVRSRELQISLGSGDEMEFKKNLQDLFAKMGELVSRNNDRTKISQMALLSNLHCVYTPLRSVLTLREMADFIIMVITKMPKSKELPEDVQRNKLEFIQETVNSELFQADESRSIILPLCLSQIKYCMIEKFMLPQVTSILGDILDNVFQMKKRQNGKKGPYPQSYLPLRVCIDCNVMRLRALGSGDEMEFKKNLQDLFAKMGELVSRNNDRTKISQMALLSNLHCVYTPLRSVLTLREMADFIIMVITKMPKSKELPEDVQRNKLEFIQETVNSELFQADESRSIILPLCLSQIKYCMIEKFMLPQVTSILGDILDNVFQMKKRQNGKKGPYPQKKCMQQDMKTMVLSVFEVILQTVLALTEKSSLSLQHQSVPEKPESEPKSPSPRKRIFPVRTSSNLTDRQRPEKYHDLRPKTEFELFMGKAKSSKIEISHMVPMCQDTTSVVSPSSSIAGSLSPEKLAKVSGELISCLVDMLRLMDEDHYEAVMKMFPEQPPLKDFLLRVFLTFQELIKPEVFPSQWTVMRLVTNNVIFTAVEYFSQALTKHFLHSEDFDQPLWQHYFNLSVAFITQPSLQLEKYSEAKRKKTKERYQDMRVPMGYQIQTLWEKLGNNQRHFIPSLIGPFLEVTLVPEHELRLATLPIFYDMMKCEQRITGNFLLVENEMIEKLDMFITTCGKGDNQYRELFRTKLLDKVQADPTLQENGSQFILSVTSLLERLLDYRNVYDGEENGDRRMQSTFNILNFYKDNSNRQEMYMRYIKKLYDLHFTAKNYVEAGLTLQLYGKLLNWTDEMKQGEMGYPPQPEWERKEGLYLKVIECFDKGKVWEFGIPLCKELAKFYEERLEYRKLSQILQKQAAFFSKILDGVEVVEDGQKKFSPRLKPTFFRVAYYGRNFPPFVRNKAFVYRGNEYLKLQDVINQLVEEFPKANIMNKTTEPTEEMKEGEELNIQICAVEPVAEERPEFRNCPNAAAEIKQFYNANDVDTFQFDKSYHRGEKDKNNEFKTLCTERVLMTTTYKLPGILQWYEVVRTETVTLNPLRTAIEAVESACQKLKHNIAECKRNPNEDNIKSLSMLLNGMITASVMGGIPKYQDAFFSNEFAIEHPDETHLCPELKRCIHNQLRLLDEGVKQMRKAGSKELMGMVKNLEETLKTVKQGMADKGSMTSLNRRTDSGNDSLCGNGGMYLARPNTPSTCSVNSSGSRSSEYSVSTLSIEEIYTDPEETSHPPHHFNLSPLIPPPPPEKRRHSQHIPVGSPGQHVSFGSPRSAVPPPIPSRPHSLCLNGLAAHQIGTQILSPRHGSDPNIGHPAIRPISSYSVAQEGDYLYPDGPPTPCEVKAPDNYVSPCSPPIPTPTRRHPSYDSPPPSPSPSMISTTSTQSLQQRRTSDSTNDELPPVLPKKAPHPALPPKINTGGGAKTVKLGKVPPLPPRQPTVSPKSPGQELSRSTSNISTHSRERILPMVARSNNSSTTNLNNSASADYKQLEVVPNEPPPIPQRHSQRIGSPPQVTPRPSVPDRKSTTSIEFENTPL